MPNENDLLVAFEDFGEGVEVAADELEEGLFVVTELLPCEAEVVAAGVPVAETEPEEVEAAAGAEVDEALEAVEDELAKVNGFGASQSALI